MKRKLTALIMVVALVLVGCAGSNSSSSNNNSSIKESKEKVEFNLSTPDPDTSSITIAAQEFAKIVSEKSDGTIEIKVFPNGSLYGGDPGAAVKQLGAGSLDILTLSTLLYANFEPKFNAISIPYLFDDTDQLLAYFNSEYGEALLNSLDSLGIKGLSLWTRSFRQITNSKRPIHTPEDMKGLRLRVPNNPLWVEFFKAVGTAPTPMAFGEVYNALQLKTVDGQENPIDIPVSTKFYEVQKYVTISNHMADGWVLGINAKKFNELTPEQQKILTEAAAETQLWKMKYDTEQDKKDVETLKEKGMEINILTAEERQQFLDIAKGLYPKFKDLVKDDNFFQGTLKFVGKDD